MIWVGVAFFCYVRRIKKMSTQVADTESVRKSSVVELSDLDFRVEIDGKSRYVAEMDIKRGSRFAAEME